jgi:hypothetical protein
MCTGLQYVWQGVTGEFWEMWGLVSDWSEKERILLLEDSGIKVRFVSPDGE